MDGEKMKKFLNKRGITLIELMSTVVIIGIVSVMAVPRFQIAYDRLKFRSANRGVVSTLRLARSIAISSKAYIGLQFDPNSKVVTLFKKDSAGATSLTFESSDSTLRVDTLPVDFSYVGTDLGNNILVYKPNGAANFTGGGNIITMESTDRMTGIYHINVLGSTGRVHSTGYYY